MPCAMRWNVGAATLPPSSQVENELAGVRGAIDGHRAKLAEVRAEAQALARESGSLKSEVERFVGMVRAA